MNIKAMTSAILVAAALAAQAEDRLIPYNSATMKAYAPDYYSNKDDKRTPTMAIDGSGLTEGKHGTTPKGTMWMSKDVTSTENRPKWFIVDLGEIKILSKLHVWNYNQPKYTQRGIMTLSVYASRSESMSTDSFDSGDWTLAKSKVDIAKATAKTDYAGQDVVFDSAVCARWIAFSFSAYYTTDDDYCGLSEIQFYEKDGTEALPVLESASVAQVESGFSVTAKLVRNRAKLTALSSDDVSEDPVETLIAEDAPEREDVSGALTGLSENTTYSVVAKAENEAGSDEMPVGVIYTGIPEIAKVSDANEDGLVHGTFTVTRADVAHDLVVNYTCGGTAVEGVNYQELSGTVVIPAGASSATIDVIPCLARPHDAATSLTITLAPGNYLLGDEPRSATMTIKNLPPPADKNVWVALEDGNASVPSNWSLGRVPTETDDILLDGGFSTAALIWDGATEGLPHTVASWTQTASYTSRVTMPTTRSGAFTQFVVTGNATLNGGEWWRDGNVKGDGNTAKVWLNVKINGDLSVGEGFTFNGAESGYPKQKGPSSGGEKGGAGGAHGGLGGGGTYGHGTVYGDYRNPITLGSGQYGSDAAGGGAVILEVGGDFVLDGKVTGDSGNGGTGSGQSGGSVWIRAKTLSGGTTGLISANGGSPSNKRAGGGAGRISVQLSDPTWTQKTLAENFKGTIRAIGGYDSKGGDYARVPGASGTVYLETAGDQGKGVMRLVNSSWSGQSPHNAVTLVGDGVKWDVSKVVMANNGRVGVASGGELHVPSFSAITGDATVYSLFAFIGGAVTSDIKHDKFVASGFDLAVYATTGFGDYHLEVPADRKLSVAADAVFTVGSLKVNGTKLAAGEYVASSLTETYPNVSGAGTIKVLGLADGLMLLVR